MRCHTSIGRARCALVFGCAILAAGVAVLATGCATDRGLSVSSTYNGSPTKFVINATSKAIAQNAINDDNEVTLHVLLPPSYLTTTRSYPVVYFLPGFGEYAGEIEAYQSSAFQAAFAANPDHEFIVVGVTGSNRLGGSFYVNSPATGNWEDYVMQEVIPFVDGKYRTIKSRDARGLYGFSMGGFGAFNLGLKHPDIFAAVFAASPGLLAPDGLKNAMPTWDNGFLEAYGAAFSPDLNGKAPNTRSVPRNLQ